MAGRAGPGAAATRRFLGVAQIVNGFERCVGANEMEDVILLGRTDPGKFRPVEFHFRAADQLIEIKPWLKCTKSQPVRLGNVVDVIRCDDPTSARHVLDEYGGVSGNMLADMLRHEACPKIVTAASG